MNAFWASEPKANLTPDEVLKVAHAHLINGIDQHTLASIFCVNQGRVNEAVTVIRWVAENHKLVHRELQTGKWNGEQANDA